MWMRRWRLRRSDHWSSDTVAFHTWWRWYHLLSRTGFGSFWSTNTSFCIWGRRRFQDHIQGWCRRRPGYIFRFMYICDETPYVYVFIVTTCWWIWKLRMEGHVAPPHGIIRRANSSAPVRDYRMWWSYRATSIVTRLVLGGRLLFRARHNVKLGEWRTAMNEKRLSVWPSKLIEIILYLLNLIRQSKSAKSTFNY